MWEEQVPEEGKETEEEVVDAIDALRDEPDEEDDSGDQEPEETIEDIAKEIGWNPNHKKSEFVSAAEFIRKGNDLRANASKGLKETKRKLESMESAIMGIKKHYETTAKAQAVQYKKQIEALKKRRVEAIEEGDTEAVDQVESEIYELHNAIEEPEQKNENAPDPEKLMVYDEWRKENPWYSPSGKGGDIEKTLYADEIAEKLSRYPDLPYERMLEITAQKVNEKFSKSVPKTTQVEGARPGRPKGHGVNVTLNKEEKAIGRDLVNSGVMTWDQYKADIALQREV